MMISRRLLLAGAGSVAVLAGLRWLQGSDVEAAASFEIEKSDADWRRLLTSAQYDVLRRQGTEQPFSSALNHEKRKGTLRLRGLRPAAVLVGHQVRKRHRLAELLSAVAGRGRNVRGSRLFHEAHRGALPPLRRPSRPCVRRRTAADRAALLHERGGVEVHARGRRAGLTVRIPGIFCRRRAESCRPGSSGSGRLFHKSLINNDFISGTGLAKTIRILRPSGAKTVPTGRSDPSGELSWVSLTL